MKFSVARFPVFPFSRFLVVLVVATLLISQASAQVVEIPDPNLERAIREELGLSSEVPITQQEMLQLTGFAVEVAEVETLIGLEYATNLKSLYLPRDNPIKDLTPLAKLTQLELLHMPGVPINDLTPLGNLTQLKDLTLTSCGIRDISPLASLTQLILLNLNSNAIVDVSPLANLTALEELWLEGNDIVDVSPLANLTALKKLYLEGNPIVDVSPVQGLSLTDFRYSVVNASEACVLPASPIQDRIDNRNLPSVVLGWSDGLLNRGGTWWDESIPYDERVAHHDLYFGGMRFGLHFGTRFRRPSEGYQVIGDLPDAIARREKLRALNPNMLFLTEIRIWSVDPNSNHSAYPEDWVGWLRDADGNVVTARSPNTYLIDIRLPEVQDAIVEQAIAVAKCGLYDGIFFDGWADGPVPRVGNWNADGSPQFYEIVDAEILVSTLQRIRANVRDDFLIMFNSNRRQMPKSVSYINGSFMETFPPESGYTRADIIEIEDSLIWYEANVQEPKINCLRALGIGHEPPDSPRNKQWMRLFTTMSLTLSDGYALYTLGHIGGQKQYQKHIWHAFWDANLGQPVGPTAQQYQEDIEGLYIREFTNGWAVYNRSGEPQTIALPSSASSVSDRGSTAASLTHLLPDLDGEIYLKAKNPADVNGDGRINVLDLVHVANNFGKADPDLNGDGVVNILDLTLVAKHLSQNAAAPSQLALIESIPSTAKEVIAVQHALTELEAIPNKSHGVQIAIELLRHYLSIAAPNVQETKLLSNYPNPFNPDTWIPYQLSEGATVTVKIYDVTGSLVRTIQVGHKPAGYYLTRERAIYWDGRNQNREPVSSGVYFYTLNTDTYTQTRRMVILK